MNDMDVLERVAATNRYSGGSVAPPDALPAAVALQRIKRRLGMQTHDQSIAEEAAAKKPTTRPRRAAALAVFAAIILVAAIGLVIVNRDAGSEVAGATNTADELDRSLVADALNGDPLAPVVALANPGGMGLRVTVGYVSGTERSFRGPRGRVIKGSLEHTAPLLPGSSGGPVVDRDGRLLGINTNRLGEGFYLAIPSGDHLTQTVDRLREGEASTRVRLGVGVAPNDVVRKLRRSVGLEEVDGLLIRYAEENSPAAAAGLREGDVLSELNGMVLNSIDDLYEALGAIAPGTTVTAKLVRGVEELEIEIGF